MTCIKCQHGETKRYGTPVNTESSWPHYGF
jgi:hypothetical protein